MSSNLNEAQLAFMRWLILPDVERKELGMPTTQTGYALYANVRPETLSQWKKLPDFRPALFRETWFTHLIDEFPGIMREAVKRAKGDKGSRDFATIMRAIEPYLPQLLGIENQTTDESKLLEDARTKLPPDEYERLVSSLSEVNQIMGKLKQLPGENEDE